MPYTDLTAAAGAQHRYDLLVGAATARRTNRDGERAGRARTHYRHPVTAWRNWLEAGRL